MFLNFVTHRALKYLHTHIDIYLVTLSSPCLQVIVLVVLAIIAGVLYLDQDLKVKPGVDEEAVQNRFVMQWHDIYGVCSMVSSFVS